MSDTDGQPVDELGGEPVLVITTRRTPTGAIITLSGELDLDGTGRFADEVDAAMANGTSGTVELDLHGLRFIDSTGLQALLIARETVGRAGATFRIPNASLAVRRICDLAGVDDLLPPDDSAPSDVGIPK